MTITTADGKQVDGLNQSPFEPIAVIGMAALMPDATSIEEFWQNIIDAHVSIKEVSKDRWDPNLLGKRRTWECQRRQDLLQDWRICRRL